ncbi:hypothetical protein RJ641_031638 [Dillenia turbinata]|uniref:Uncharacterized protein n=1 Tax=Dillenia turbinata TaxID=194707 RepID=A0AAN8ZL56_9MAGN
MGKSLTNDHLPLMLLATLVKTKKGEFEDSSSRQTCSNVGQSFKDGTANYATSFFGAINSTATSAKAIFCDYIRRSVWTKWQHQWLKSTQNIDLNQNQGICFTFPLLYKVLHKSFEFFRGFAFLSILRVLNDAVATCKLVIVADLPYSMNANTKCEMYSLRLVLMESVMGRHLVSSIDIVINCPRGKGYCRPVPLNHAVMEMTVELVFACLCANPLYWPTMGEFSLKPTPQSFLEKL